MPDDERRARIEAIVAETGPIWATDRAIDALVALVAEVEIAKNEIIDAYHDTVVDLVFQFGYQTTHEHQPALWTGGLSALEGAFALLGWDDPHPCPEFACQMPECTEWATTGTPTSDGYKRLCSDHFWLVQDDEQRATT